MSTGIIRRIDDLGRVVIPKEIRRNLRIKNGDNLEIVVNDDEIVLRKYSQIENAIDMTSLYVEAFNQVLKYNVLVTDTDKIVSFSGSLKNKYLNNGISDRITNMIERRECFVEHKKSSLELSPGMSLFGYYAFATIIKDGDSIGSVIIFSIDTPLMEQEEKLASILANILSNYFVS